MTDEQMDPVAEEIEAIKRIAMSADGAVFHRYLRRVLEACFDAPDPSALLLQNGRRTLARDLMRLMAEGINDDRTEHSGGNAPILTRSGGAVAVRGRARRDPSRYPRVDSFDDSLNPDGSDPTASAGKA